MGIETMMGKTRFLFLALSPLVFANAIPVCAVAETSRCSLAIGQYLGNELARLHAFAVRGNSRALYAHLQTKIAEAHEIGVDVSDFQSASRVQSVIIDEEQAANEERERSQVSTPFVPRDWKTQQWNFADNYRSAVSPNGSFTAALSVGKGSLFVYDAGTGAVVAQVKLSDELASGGTFISFSADESKIYLSSSEKPIGIITLEWRTGRQLQQINKGELYVTVVESPDARWLQVLKSGRREVLDKKSGSKVFDIWEGAEDLVFSADGSLIVAHKENTALVYDLDRKIDLSFVPYPSGTEVHSVAPNATGSTLAISASIAPMIDTISLWSADSQQHILDFDPDAGFSRNLSFRENDEVLFAFNGSAATIQIFQTSTGVLIDRLKRPEASLNEVVSNTGNRIVSHDYFKSKITVSTLGMVGLPQ
jgi:WD40 repeat protein